jgi:hypothetical protein
MSAGIQPAPEIASFSNVYQQRIESPTEALFANSLVAALVSTDPMEQLSLNSGPPNPFITPGKDGPGQSVPDSGATLTLLGASLMGLTAFRRKFVK